MLAILWAGIKSAKLPTRPQLLRPRHEAALQQIVPPATERPQILSRRCTVDNVQRLSDLEQAQLKC